MSPSHEAYTLRAHVRGAPREVHSREVLRYVRSRYPVPLYLGLYGLPRHVYPSLSQGVGQVRTTYWVRRSSTSALVVAHADVYDVLLSSALRRAGSAGHRCPLSSDPSLSKCFLPMKCDAHFGAQLFYTATWTWIPLVSHRL